MRAQADQFVGFGKTSRCTVGRSMIAPFLAFLGLRWRWLLRWPSYLHISGRVAGSLLPWRLAREAMCCVEGLVGGISLLR